MNERQRTTTTAAPAAATTNGTRCKTNELLSLQFDSVCRATVN